MLEIGQTAETTEPTPQPAEKTKSQLFKEALEKYSDRETAKTHMKEIADRLQCRKSLGYKVIKDIVFPNEKGQAPPATEPTARIPEATPEPLPETPEPTPTDQAPAQAQITETPQEIQPLETPAEISAHVTVSPTVQKLEPILERSISRLFNSAIEQLSGAKQALTDQEAKDTAILLPIMLYRLTKTNLSEDQFIDLTCVTHFGSIVLKVVAPKLKEWFKRTPEKPRNRKPEKPETDPSQQQLPVEPLAPEPTPEITAPEKPKGEKILQQLGGLT